MKHPLERWSVVMIAAGCVSGSPAMVRTVPASAASFRCAEALLRAEGLAVEPTEARGVMAESRTALGPAHGQRDVITVDHLGDSADTQSMRIRVASYRYEPSYSSSRTARQLVTEIRPDPQMVETGLRILEQCGHAMYESRSPR